MLSNRNKFRKMFREVVKKLENSEQSEGVDSRVRRSICGNLVSDFYLFFIIR